MPSSFKSGCPINLTLEVLGDRWSLLIIRDVMFGNRRHYRDLLENSEEGISTNILAERLKTLVDRGILTTAGDPAHKQKTVYSLTERGIELLPMLAQIGGWGGKFLPVSRPLAIRTELLFDGGPRMWERFMDELRERHLGASTRRQRRRGVSVTDQLQEAYEAAIAESQSSNPRR